MRCIAFVMAALLSPVLWAETDPPTVDAQASATGDTQSAACERAFSRAEEEALARIDAADTRDETPGSQRVELRSRTDERLGEDESGRFECRVNGTWATVPSAETTRPIGGVESIEGRYRADCAAADNGAACRRDIERQAASDLLDALVDGHALTRDAIELEADGFDGSQSFNYQGRDLTLTMDGEFFYRVREAGPAPVRPEPARGTEGDVRINRDAGKDRDHFTDDLDFTLFYTWDGNDSAGHDELALSTSRWGIGLWVDNRFGVSAFWGEERVGIADSGHDVHSLSDRYDVQGIGIGYRMFDNRAVTLENMLHFVDAQPYRTTLTPDCDGCTDRTYEANDYYQASINLKTNTESLNIGWMLTWKLRDDLANYDSLSGGLYLELQF